MTEENIERRNNTQKETAVFLDVDGVINCTSTKERAPGNANIIGIDSEKVTILKEIATAVNGELVLTSTSTTHHLTSDDV